jgi:hypothetical protein
MIGAALRAVGYVTIDQQATVLGLCRSTTWVVLQAHHKASGLNATTINRMLAAPNLPATVRAKILDYVEEKSAGLYGHSRSQRRKFVTNTNADKEQQQT